MDSHTYEENRNGERYVYAFSDVWTARRVEGVELSVYRGDLLIVQRFFPGESSAATAAAWRFIERLN